MLHISLFSGIGGFDLAAQWMGWTNIVSCEINPFGRKILAHYWPDAYHHDDIHTLTYQKINDELQKRFGPNWRTDDIVLSGGFPCQPYSTAGKRLGKEDERHLWPEMLRAIREVSPRYVVGENVRGLTNWNGGVVFDEVQADLEAEGYEVLPFLLPACGVGAPHRRDRIWFIAHAKGAGMHGEKGNVRKEDGRQGAGLLPEPIFSGSGYGENRATAHARSDVHAGGLDAGRDQRQKGGSEGQNEQPGGWNENGQWLRAEPGTSGTDAAHAFGKGLQGRERSRKSIRFESGTEVSDWRNWPTQSPLCNGDDGLSSFVDSGTIRFTEWRKESIKAAGNAVVPQVVYQIFKAIEQYEMMISEQEQSGSVATTAPE